MNLVTVSGLVLIPKALLWVRKHLCFYEIHTEVLTLQRLRNKYIYTRTHTYVPRVKQNGKIFNI